MRLLRVQVPEFRALKDVDITFEKDFTPAVFPVGSQNGGGKSTLLQLIFALLHCSFNEDRKHFLQNILKNFRTDSEPRLLSKIHILDIKNEITLEFFVIQIEQKIDSLNEDTSIDDYMPEFLEEQKIYELKKVLQSLMDAKEISKKLEESIKKTNASESGDIRGLARIEIPKLNQLLLQNSLNIINTYLGAGLSVPLVEHEVEKINLQINKKIEQVADEIKNIKALPIISTSLKSERLEFICTYDSAEQQSGALAFRSVGQEIDIKEFMNRISRQVFLAAPSTQVFIFSSKEQQKLLFKEGYKNKEYYSFAKDIELFLPGLFTYDFLSVDLLIEAFKDARDKDFESAIRFGKYSHNYHDLINDLNLILGNKKINISLDLSEITFKLLSESGDEIDLYPEDLSHGELKRLSLYMWLRFRLIEDSIVLMDEVEIAFHPDWQYQIVSDLAHWAPSNQYILATHSYELCQAVTPAHVKELEPKLIKAEN
jgi:predicted ATPase